MMAGPVILDDHEATLCLALATAASEAAELLAGDVVAVVPPGLRAQVAHVARRLRGAAVAGPDLLHDLSALEARLRPLVDEATFYEWHADENHVRGGCEVVVLTDEARLVARAMAAITQVRAASRQLAAFAQAMRVRTWLPTS